MSDETIETMPEPTELPLTVRSQQTEHAVSVTDKPKTAQECRTLEVSEALAPAYAKASTLEMSDQEVAALTAPFPDGMIEIRPHDGLIYIPHIHISDRLNQVFRPGKWAMVLRRYWVAENTMYGEYVLLIRGCYVGESVGGHPYQPNNPKVNYSDTLESTAGEALRRICGKRLSCGSQVWNPEYARNWVAANAVKVNGRWERRISGQSAPQAARPPSAQPQAPKTPAKPAGGVKKTPSLDEAKCKARFLERIAQAKAPIPAWAWAVETGLIMPNETLAALPAHRCPQSAEEFEAAMSAIEALFQSKQDEHGNLDAEMVRNYDAAHKPTIAQDDSNEPPGGWQGATGAPEPEDELPMGDSAPQEGQLRINGFIAATNSKPTKNGRKKFGVCITQDRNDRTGGMWLNHFSDTISAECAKLSGKRVSAIYTTGQYGNTLESITEDK